MKIGVVCRAKDEQLIIKDWVNHYLQLGFTKIIVYDNCSSPPLREAIGEEIMTKFSNRVEINIDEESNSAIHNKITRGWFEKTIKKYSDYHWFLLCDADEFLWCERETLSEYLDNVPGNVGTIAIPWVVFGTGGNKTFNTSKHVFQQFTLCGARVNPWNKYTKSLCRPSNILKVVNVHSARPKEGFSWVTPDGVEAKLDANCTRLVNHVNYSKMPLMIAHYMTLDHESMNKKFKRNVFSQRGDHKYTEGWYNKQNLDICADKRMLKYLTNIKSFDLCLTGLLARSYKSTLHRINELIVKPAKNNGYSVNIHIFAIDPEDELVDTVKVQHKQAVSYAKKQFGWLDEITERKQEELDERATELGWWDKLSWLRQVGPGRVPLQQHRGVPYIPNMYRHLQIERLAGEYLENSKSDICVAMVPDIEVDFDSTAFFETLAAIDKNEIVVPKGSSTNESLGIVNGFAAGTPQTVARFLNREKLIPFRTDSENEVQDNVNTPIVHVNGYLNWERMCSKIVNLERMSIKEFPISILKKRANGMVKLAWMCSPK